MGSEETIQSLVRYRVNKYRSDSRISFIRDGDNHLLIKYADGEDKLASSELASIMKELEQVPGLAVTYSVHANNLIKVIWSKR